MKKTPDYDSVPQSRDRFLYVLPHRHADATTNAIPQWHEALEIKLFYTSGTTLVIGDEVFLASAGDVFVIDPCVSHSTVDEDPGNDYHMLDVDLARLPATPGSTAGRILEALSAGELRFMPHIPGDRILAERIEAVVRAYAEDPDGLAALGETYLLLDALVTRASRNAEAIPAKNAAESARKLAPALSLLQRDYVRRLTLQELGDTCGLHPRYFCRLFRDKTGKTVTDYLACLRIGHACVLLKSTDLSVDEIAVRSGFSDRDYFARIFKRHRGCTPLQYRKRLSIG